MTSPIQYGVAGQSETSLYYRHSGQTPAASIVLSALVGIAVGVVAAVIYAYAITYIPYAKLRFLATMGFGAAVGGSTAAIAKWGKVRSVPIVLGLVLLTTAIAYYASWVVWLKLVFDRAFEGDTTYDLTYLQLLKPNTFWSAIQFINEVGTWAQSKTDKENTKGVMLGIIWAIEAASILGVAFIVAASLARAAMFCEACANWSSGSTVLGRFAPGNTTELKSRLEAHDLDYLDTLLRPNSAHYWELTYTRCHTCDTLHAISVKQYKVATNKKGQVTNTKSKTLINRLLVTGDEIRFLTTPKPSPAQTQINISPDPPIP